MIKTISWLALIIAVSANVASNHAFKMAVSRWTSDGEGHWWTLIVDPVFWIGLGLAGVLLGAYLYALRAIPLSIAYPSVTGLAMVGIAITGTQILGESLSQSNIAGIGLIAVGVFLLAWS